MSKPNEKMEYIDINFSLLTVLKNNLRLANRVIYIHRIIYTGDHSFPNDDNNNVSNIFAKAINEIDNMFSYEPLSGLLLYYTRYYIHMLEGPEESIMAHLKKIFDNNFYRTNFKRGKVVVTYHNINQRFFKKWGARFAVPPTLLTPLPEDANEEETLRHLKKYTEKIYNLCKFLKNPPPQDEEEEESWVEMGAITEKAAEFLPEYAFLDFLLNSNYLLDLQEYVNEYKYLSEIVPVEDNVWPVALEEVPFDIFEPTEDPIQNLYKQEDEPN